MDEKIVDLHAILKLKLSLRKRTGTPFTVFENCPKQSYLDSLLVKVLAYTIKASFRSQQDKMRISDELQALWRHY